MDSLLYSEILTWPRDENQGSRLLRWKNLPDQIGWHFQRGATFIKRSGFHGILIPLQIGATLKKRICMWLFFEWKIISAGKSSCSYLFSFCIDYINSEGIVGSTKYFQDLFWRSRCKEDAKSCVRENLDSTLKNSYHSILCILSDPPTAFYVINQWFSPLILKILDPF